MCEKRNGSYIMKRILSVILALAVILPRLNTVVWAAEDDVMPTELTAAGSFAGGDGTEDEPYLIETAAQLKLLADKVNEGDETYNGAYYMLTADIDLGGSEENQWTPIGTRSYNFKGTFDGGGHLISGLYINTKQDYQGLFGFVSGGTVKNLGVDGEVTGFNYVGGVVGRVDGGTVENCYNTGYVSGTDAGGVVGENGGTTKNCYNTGIVYNDQGFIGGVVGDNTSGTVENCYNTGNVIGKNTVGGVVGEMGWTYFKSSGTVKNCYNTGNVGLGAGISISYNVGGVVGYSNSDNPVQNCYNTGNVNGTDVSGGIVGTSESDNTAQNCFFLYDSASQGIGNDNNGSAGTTPIYEAEFANQDTFTDWDFDTIWVMSSFCNRPILVSAPESTFEGSGDSEDDPYLINTPQDLVLLAALVNDGNSFDSKYFELADDIDLSKVCGEGIGSWTPIGTYSMTYDIKEYPFTGTFDGDGHMITGLYVDNASSSYQGLFGYVCGGGVIKNLGVDGQVKGRANVGGIVGCLGSADMARVESAGTVQNCYYTGSVEGSGDYVGGIVGRIGNMVSRDEYCNVVNCYNAGNVS